jgi:DNA polymerase-3 subunit delta'
MALKPYEAGKRAFVLEDAHSLTGEAQDALLKVLEEPQDNSIFILITSKPHLLRQTVISRCQRIRFSEIPDAIIEAILSNEFTLKRDDLTFVNNFSSGSLGDAKRLAGGDFFLNKNSILDTFIISPRKKISGDGFLELANELKSFRKKEGPKASAGGCGIEFKDVIRIFLSFFRDIIMFKIGRSEALINFDRALEIERFSREYELDELYAKLNSIMELENLLLQNANEELAFIGMFEEILN